MSDSVPFHAASIIETTEQSYGRGVFDTQPRVLCAECNNAWMTKHEDVAGPIIARMIRNEKGWTISSVEARHIATWALAALMIRSTVDKALTRVERTVSTRLRMLGIESIDAAVLVAPLENTRTLFDGPAVGSSYICNAKDRARDAMAIFFFQSVAVLVGVGAFAARLELAAAVYKDACVAVWPNPPRTASWPPRACLLDRNLPQIAGMTDFSRSLFLPSRAPRGRTYNTILRTPAALLETGVSTDLLRNTAAVAFQEIAARHIAAR